MFAPTRAYAMPVAYVYLVTHKRAVLRRGGPFRRRRPSASERSSGDILFPGIFMSRYITHRPGPRRSWRYAPRGPNRKGSGRAIPPLSPSLFLSLFFFLPFFFLLSLFPRECTHVYALIVRVTSSARVTTHVEFPFFSSFSSARADLISRRECKSPRTIAISCGVSCRRADSSS